MQKRLPFLFGLLIVIILLGTQSLFVVHQTERALVIQLGDPVDEVFGPGLHFKIPFIQEVVRFNARVLDYEARPAEALTSDKKTIVLDNYARWRIVDPLKFYRTVRTIPGAQARLDDVVYSQLRAQVGQRSLTEVVSSKRSGIMTDVTRRASDIMKEYGIEVVDVRIKRTDLPAENQRAIFGRMRAEPRTSGEAIPVRRCGRVHQTPLGSGQRACCDHGRGQSPRLRHPGRRRCNSGTGVRRGVLPRPGLLQVPARTRSHQKRLRGQHPRRHHQ